MLRELVMLYLTKSGGSSGKIEGATAPISIPTAVSAPLKSLVQHGLCVQASAPTPTNPVDIKCNNGVISGTRSSGLPIKYQRVEWIKSTDISGITITGFKTNDNMEITCEFYQEDAFAQFLYASDSSRTGTTNTAALLGATDGPFRFGDKSYTFITPSRATKHTTIQNKEGVWLDGEKVGSYTDVNSFTSSADLKLLARYSTTTNLVIRMYSLKVEEGNATVLDLTPVKNIKTNQLGLYDKVGKKFYSASAIAGDEIEDPIEITGTSELISLGSQTATAVNLLSVGAKEDEQDIISGTVKRRVGITVLDGDETWNLMSSNTIAYTTILDCELSRHVAMCTHYVGTDEPNASMPINSIKCSQANGEGRIYIKLDSATTVGDFKDFLEGQSANGKPVIVLYPLLDEIHEADEPQPLSLQEGSNTLTVTAEVSGIKFDVKYQKA